MTRNGLDDVKACDVRSGWMTSHVGSEQVVNSSHGILSGARQHTPEALVIMDELQQVFSWECRAAASPRFREPGWAQSALVARQYPHGWPPRY